MNQKGISLIELIVVMAISAVIGWIVFSMFLNMNRTVIDQNAILDVQASERNAVGSMVRVLRETGLDPLRSADAGVEEATHTKLRITRDANLNGVIEESLQERVTFQFVDRRLRRGTDEGTASEKWVDMSADVAALEFVYRDASGADLGEPGTDIAQLSAIRVIEIELSLQDDKVGGEPFTRTLTTTVQGRNL